MLLLLLLLVSAKLFLSFFSSSHAVGKKQKKSTKARFFQNEILPFVATWRDLEGIMLSEINQTEKDNYCMISLICGI